MIKVELQKQINELDAAAKVMNERDGVGVIEADLFKMRATQTELVAR